MFDDLDTSALERMIRHLTEERDATHRKMIGPDMRPVIDPLSSEWRTLAVRYDEIASTVGDAYAELIRREESAGSHALRDLRNARGIDA